MKQMEYGSAHFYAILIIASAGGVAASLVFGVWLGTGRFSWTQFAVIAVAVNIFLAIGVPLAGERPVENFAKYLVFLVLAIWGSYGIEGTIIPFMVVTVCGAAAGMITSLVLYHNKG